MQDMRRIDVWIGRAVAAAGIVYVVLASVWPFAADAADERKSAAVFAVVSSIALPANIGDLGLARVVADVATRRERRDASSSRDERTIRGSARVAQEIAVLPPWSIASDVARDAGPSDAPLPAFSALAVVAAIAISAGALRDQRRTGMAFDVR